MFQELVFITASACQSGQCPKATVEPVKVKTYEVIQAPAQAIFVSVEPVRARRNLLPNLFGRRNDALYLMPVSTGGCSLGKCR